MWILQSCYSAVRTACVTALLTVALRGDTGTKCCPQDKHALLSDTLLSAGTDFITVPPVLQVPAAAGS